MHDLCDWDKLYGTTKTLNVGPTLDHLGNAFQNIAYTAAVGFVGSL